MIYLQPITFYAIIRDMRDPDKTEIAEHPDGAMKAYAERWQATEALALMGPDHWRVEEILMVPPPMTAAAHHEALAREVAGLKVGSPTYRYGGVPPLPIATNKRKTSK